MSFIANLFSGANNPQLAPTQTVTNAGQVQSAVNNSQNAIQQQQGLLNALQGQNGLGNQSQVYGQLQNVVNGQGPNPAQAQLAQSTAANTQNQAALQAGQRGSSANAGLIARQAAQQGGANQQAAAGQAATLQAQQSLGALGQAGQMANTQAGQQIAGTGAVTEAQQNQQNQLLNALTAQNNTAVSNQAQYTNAATTQQGQGISALGGLAGGVGSAISGAGKVLGLAEGGSVEHPAISHFKSLKMAKGGKVPALVSPGEVYLPPNKVSEVVKGKKDPIKAGEKIPGKPKYSGNDYRNDTVSKTLKSGGIVIPNEVMQSKNPHQEAYKFVNAVLAKQNLKKGKR